jgi:hypothetical protein
VIKIPEGDPTQSITERDRPRPSGPSKILTALTVSNIARWTTIAGIWVLILLGIVDGIAYIYGSRKETLVAAAEHAAAAQRQEHDAQERARHEANAAKMNEELTRARADAEEARQQAANAGQMANTLKLKAAPRHLTNAQRQTLIDVLKSFAGHKKQISRSAWEIVSPMLSLLSLSRCSGLLDGTWALKTVSIKLCTAALRDMGFKSL